jgi:hypothetical protein
MVSKKKSCKKSQVRSSKTGRCKSRKISVTKKSTKKKSCKKSQVRSRKTGRCKSRKTSTKKKSIKKKSCTMKKSGKRALSKYNIFMKKELKKPEYANMKQTQKLKEAAAVWRSMKHM